MFTRHLTSSTRASDLVAGLKQEQAGPRLNIASVCPRHASFHGNNIIFPSSSNSFDSTRMIRLEIRFHGRGGQGAVTGVRVLATALYYEGKFTLGIPMYGTERRGAPVVSFLRVGDRRINERDLVHEPDMVVVLDPLLGRTVPVTEGLKEGGMVLINHPRGGRETGLGGKFRVATVDATGIAMTEIGRPITNTAILGAFAKVTGMVALESLEKAIREQWGGRVAEMNVRAGR